jgi:hypothetical protein
MEVWPGQVIFGFYFVILVLAVQELQTRLATKSEDPHRQTLLLLIFVGLCLDLVLVNIQETITHVDASYGIVVLWDAATFFVWLRAVDLCRRKMVVDFAASWVIPVAPLLALGREVLFLPYPAVSYSHVPWRAYFDLMIGNGLVSLWLLIPIAQSSRRHGGGRRRVERGLAMLVLTGCVYWLLNAIENIATLAWSPLSQLLYRSFAHWSIPVPALSLVYFAFAAGTTFTLWRWDVLGLGSRLGIERTRHVG